ncbi:hypothetical protein J2853_000753 [Streptosporangium lutulentum]|uniref:DUF3618 domain-containing protein n=1 Tax=Streptosporangium lutulentum TaxID=1461250 RepID=A0ABT9Q499_9ACTN|nr:DUF3618 domain-containing protein [Streptosporangium lutulentum]MDP9841542.1 hypothetical protein [Streptosporangium lutulentum]
MTETDPERPDRRPTDAGTTGARRQEIGEALAPDESGSLNVPQTKSDGRPTEDLGVPAAERDGTPRQAENAVTGAPNAGDPGDAGEPGTGKTNKESVRRDIENARRELGDTVEALVHKTDVKGRVQETAAHMGDDLRRMGAATADTATEMVGRVKEAAPEMVDRVKEAAPEMVHRVKEAAPEMVHRMKEAAPEMVGRVKEVTPVEIKDAAGKVGAEASKRPVATIAAVAALALIVFRVLRRGKKK